MDARFIGDGTEMYFGRGEISPADKDGLLGHLRAVEASMEPAPRQAIIIALTRLAAHFWNDRPANQWKIVFEDYADDLGKIPADIVGEAITVYRTRGKFWPKVSELLEIAYPILLRRQRSLTRIRKLCDVKPTTKLGIVPAVRRFA